MARNEDDAASRADGRTRGIYHFLDVGDQKYGECTLVEFGDIRILIDGSHESDYAGQDGFASIPDQLAEILSGPPPYDITLLVVTHGHADHIGCLPALYENGIIAPQHALITDPQLGFGRGLDHDVSLMDGNTPANALAALLREEDVSDLSDSALDDFIDTVKRMEARYGDFLAALKKGGVKVYPYRGKPLPAALQEILAPTGITLLGPSADQLILCAEQIAKSNSDADSAADLVDSVTDVRRVYREIVRAGRESDGGFTRGNGMNCQSITFAFGPPDARVLLAGDMQFTEPGVVGLGDEMAKLRQKVIDEGPYALFKTTHHSSHNGQDAALLDELGTPPYIVHSGGANDKGHPYEGVLKMLKGRARDIAFARTDRNGRISVRPDAGTLEEAMVVERGRLNNFTPNKPGDEISAETSLSSTRAAPLSPVEAPGPQIIIVNLANAPIDMSVGGVDIVIRQARTDAPRPPPPALPPPRRDHAIAPPKPEPAPTLHRGAAAVGAAGPGRFEGLLFVTDPDKLRRNIGALEMKAAFDEIEAGGGALLGAPGASAIDATLNQLDADPKYKGVVLLGGYDVTPTRRIDALGDELRAILGDDDVDADEDGFWVWSDRPYVDPDDDAIAEFPVSRIPDARDADLFMAALRAPALDLQGRFGIRNTARRFADSVWADIASGTSDINVSEPYVFDQLRAEDLASTCHYYMLHGAPLDGRLFTGEYEDGRYDAVDAFAISQVPSQFNGLVFTGCCYGALIANGIALEFKRTIPAPRAPEDSIALTYLKAGALGFVGCTGAHYSGPTVGEQENYALVLHRAFWRAVQQDRLGPAAALHRAKEEQGAWLARQTRPDPRATARRMKNIAQFTCLGLGW